LVAENLAMHAERIAHCERAGARPPELPSVGTIMNPTASKAARLRLAVTGTNHLPTINPDFAALTQRLADGGITPDEVHPLITLLLWQAVLALAPQKGWSQSHALELGAEQAEEYRQLGLGYQLTILYGALNSDAMEFARCLHAVKHGQTEAALRVLEVRGWM
jgi:hypothetical protein